ncbi:hypothetical protein ACIQNU_00275 [Streptomyces sp. NPDC091292]|uniref:hypothetical protein n=1 Tax=Streptomyces sp. NPDC091292 TaxID=3365991 RepID=UPI0037FBAEDD
MEIWREDAQPGQTHDPNEVTIQIDGIGRQLAELTAQGKAQDAAGSDGPVFVDETGRRSRRYRTLGVVVGLACAVYAAVIVATVVSGNSSAPWLPIPDPAAEQPAGKVDTPPLPAVSGSSSGSPGESPGATPSTGDGTTPSPGDSAAPGATADPSDQASPGADPGTSPGVQPTRNGGGTRPNQPGGGVASPPGGDPSTDPGPGEPSTEPSDPGPSTADPSPSTAGGGQVPIAPEGAQ